MIIRPQDQIWSESVMTVPKRVAVLQNLRHPLLLDLYVQLKVPISQHVLLNPLLQSIHVQSLIQKLHAVWNRRPQNPYVLANPVLPSL